jgi:hypothetical protein
MMVSEGHFRNDLKRKPNGGVERTMVRNLEPVYRNRLVRCSREHSDPARGTVRIPGSAEGEGGACRYRRCSRGSQRTDPPVESV